MWAQAFAARALVLALGRQPLQADQGQVLTLLRPLQLEDRAVEVSCFTPDEIDMLISICNIVSSGSLLFREFFSSITARGGRGGSARGSSAAMDDAETDQSMKDEEAEADEGDVKEEEEEEEEEEEQSGALLNGTPYEVHLVLLLANGLVLLLFWE